MHHSILIETVTGRNKQFKTGKEIGPANLYYVKTVGWRMDLADGPLTSQVINLSIMVLIPLVVISNLLIVNWNKMLYWFYYAYQKTS